MRIMIADDHTVVRQGLRRILESHFSIEKIVEVDNGEEAILNAEDMKPDTIIMDISMPKLNGIDATTHILSNNPYAKIVILSMHTNRNIVLDALKAGCKAFVSKKSLLDEIVRAIEAVLQGNRYLSPEISNIVVDELLVRENEDNSHTSGRLTARERQILQLISEGLSTKQIAYQLDVSPKTIDATRARIMEKTDIHNVAELTKFAIKEGITGLDF